MPESYIHQNHGNKKLTQLDTLIIAKNYVMQLKADLEEIHDNSRFKIESSHLRIGEWRGADNANPPSFSVANILAEPSSSIVSTTSEVQLRPSTWANDEQVAQYMQSNIFSQVQTVQSSPYYDNQTLVYQAPNITADISPTGLNDDEQQHSNVLYSNLYDTDKTLGDITESFDTFSNDEDSAISASYTSL